MRLRRLDLVRYGRFTDHRIDFGAARPGEPDFHVVYGPNESGKSTTFAAFLDLLFGIERRSAYDFLHPYSTMRIGGVIETDAGARSFARIKRDSNSLLDEAGRPVAEAAIRAGLAGLERDTYRAMFSLDDASLESGGENILASKGDLGALLFSASAGLSDMSRRLEKAKEEADAFFKPGGHKHVLANLKRRLADLDAERQRLDTQASDHRRLVDERDKAAREYDEAAGESRAAKARIAVIGRLLSALPRLGDLRGARAEIAAFADLPEPPPGWRDEMPDLRKRTIGNQTALDLARDAIDRLTARLDAATLDEAAERQATASDALGDLRAREKTAALDLPERRRRAQEAELAVAALLRRLDHADEPDPARLLLPAATVGLLRGLIESRSGVVSTADAATQEHETALALVREAEARLGALAGDAPRPAASARTALAAALAQARASDHDLRRRNAERDRTRAAEALADRLRELAPWRGAADDLLEIARPSPTTVQRWKAASDSAGDMVERRREAVARSAAELARLAAVGDALAGGAGVVADREALASRAARDAAWAAHRTDLASESADAFEAAMRTDDRIAAGRLAHSVDLAKAEQNRQARIVAEAEWRQAMEDESAAVADRLALQAEIAATIGAIAPALPPATPPAEFEAWLDRVGKALAARETLTAARNGLADALADGETVQRRLRAGLAAFGERPPPDAGGDALLEAAQTALDRAGAVESAHDAVAQAREAAGRRAGAASRASEAVAAWEADWSRACAACWLGEGGVARPVEAVREILSVADELSQASMIRVGFVDRIDSMERDRAHFDASIRAVADALGMDSEGVAAEALDGLIRDRIGKAIAARAHRDGLVAELETARSEARALEAEGGALARRVAEMTAFFGVATLDAVDGKLGDAAKRDGSRESAGRAARAILEAMSLADLAEAERALDGADAPALQSERGDLEARCEALDATLRDLHAARLKAHEAIEAIGADARVARIEEERRTTLLEIEAGALRHLRQSAGVLAAEQALRAYRDRHRSPLMARASEAFGTISRGAYSGLAAQPGEAGETLIARAAGGGSKAAHELSKGARFQLYLALRIAGHHEFASQRTPVPFIADDILETFDDFRAEETFRLFGEMALQGQVVYLTHHRHLCGIAKEVCPTVTLHAMDGGAP